MDKKFILNLFLGLTGLAILVPVLTLAQVTVQNPIGFNDFESLILQGIFPAVATIIGALGVVMIVWAGILFVTSAGDPGRLGKAKTALWWAIIGIAIGIAATGLIELIKKIIGA
jgi:hypothetical protein